MSLTRIAAARNLRNGHTLAHKTTSYIGYVPEVFESEEDFTEPLKCVEPGKSS
jgi:hypothetical protein